jgi:hypothetical protein
MNTDKGRVAVTLAVKFNDFVTDTVVFPADKLITVTGNGGFAVPTAKSDGYFIFTGTQIGLLNVQSKVYESFNFAPPLNGGLVLRISLIPRYCGGRVFELPLDTGAEAHIGFAVLASHSVRHAGYALSADAESGESVLTLQKNDFADLTDLPHIPIVRNADSASEELPIYLTRSLGYGKYALKEPLLKAFKARETRFLPLRRVIVTESGKLRIPLPDDSLTVYVLRNGRLDYFELSEYLNTED